jgi:hypothetical protein
VDSMLVISGAIAVYVIPWKINIGLFIGGFISL